MSIFLKMEDRVLVEAYETFCKALRRKPCLNPREQLDILSRLKEVSPHADFPAVAKVLNNRIRKLEKVLDRERAARNAHRAANPHLYKG